MTGLGQVLESLVQACNPTQDDYHKRIWLIKRIETALKGVANVCNLRVVPYGSFVSQFYNSTSDLDVAVCGNYPSAALKPASRAEIFRDAVEEENVPLHKLDKRTRTQILRSMGSRLLANGLTCSGAVQFILHARVPIIKFLEPTTGIEVDLCLGTESSGFKAWSIAQVASIHPAFGTLFRVVKAWAKAHSINDGASNMFNSWCLTLLVISFFQTHPDPPLLPPLYALLYDNVPALDKPRPMQGGKELPPAVYDIMAMRTKLAHEVYGCRPCKSVDELFYDFVEDSVRKLRSLVSYRDGSFPPDTRVSTFYGGMVPSRPFSTAYLLLVEDPYDDTDNTARTLGTRDGHPGTIHYVISVFERTLRHLKRHIARHPFLATAESADHAANESSNGSSGVSQPEPLGPSTSSASSASLASTLVFLFGTELLNRLPDLSAALLGPDLCSWAQGALDAGQPEWKVHEELLRRLGAVGEFVSFQSFKRFKEAKHVTPEEMAAAAAADAARQATKKARDMQKRAFKKAKEAALEAANTALWYGEADGVRSEMPPRPPPSSRKPAQEELGGDQIGNDDRVAAVDAERSRGQAGGSSSRPTSGVPKCKQPMTAGIGSNGAPSEAIAQPQLEASMPPGSPHRPPSTPQQGQPRRRLAPHAHAALAKALGPKPGKPIGGPSSDAGPGARSGSQRSATEGVADSSTTAVTVGGIASRPTAVEATAEAQAVVHAKERTSGASGTNSTCGDLEQAAIAAAKAAATAAATGQGVTKGPQRRQRERPSSKEVQLQSERTHTYVDAESSSASTETAAIQAALRGLLVSRQESGEAAGRQQQGAADGTTQVSRGGRRGRARGSNSTGSAQQMDRRRKASKFVPAHSEEAPMPP